jgi:hypothetical protein
LEEEPHGKEWVHHFAGRAHVIFHNGDSHFALSNGEGVETPAPKNIEKRAGNALAKLPVQTGKRGRLLRLPCSLETGKRGRSSLPGIVSAATGAPIRCRMLVLMTALYRLSIALTLFLPISHYHLPQKIDRFIQHGFLPGGHHPLLLMPDWGRQPKSFTTGNRFS